jgi:uncharacterized protein with ATP-grasp and redox domains
MNITQECVSCIINQSQRVADAIEADEVLHKELVKHVSRQSVYFDFHLSPPEVAADVYEDMANIAQKEDLYDEVKRLSTKKARSFIPFLKKQLQNSKNRLLTATKIAVAGNVIDLAAAVEFDLQEELDKIFHTEFAHDDFSKLTQALESAKRVTILGDNVGEHIFDYLFIEVLQELYPEIDFSYMVRGNPIINDVTMKEAREAGFDELCELIDSGVNTPGFTYSRANSYAKKVFDNADLVISKGMGNYECLSPSHRQNICFLLKVKCDVVANSIGAQVGDIICKIA